MEGVKPMRCPRCGTWVTFTYFDTVGAHWHCNNCHYSSDGTRTYRYDNKTGAWTEKDDELWKIPSIAEAPTFESPAVKTGRWLIPQRRCVMSWNEKAYAECSVCHEVIFNARSMKYCPQCGARMVNDNE